MALAQIYKNPLRDIASQAADIVGKKQLININAMKMGAMKKEAEDATSLKAAWDAAGGDLTKFMETEGHRFTPQQNAAIQQAAEKKQAAAAQRSGFQDYATGGAYAEGQMGPTQGAAQAMQAFDLGGGDAIAKSMVDEMYPDEGNELMNVSPGGTIVNNAGEVIFQAPFKPSDGAAPKLYEVETEGPDGKKMLRLVGEEEYKKGVAGYDKPSKADAPPGYGKTPQKANINGRPAYVYMPEDPTSALSPIEVKGYEPWAGTEGERARMSVSDLLDKALTAPLNITEQRMLDDAKLVKAKKYSRMQKYTTIDSYGRKTIEVVDLMDPKAAARVLGTQEKQAITDTMRMKAFDDVRESQKQYAQLQDVRHGYKPEYQTWANRGEGWIERTLEKLGSGDSNLTPQEEREFGQFYEHHQQTKQLFSLYRKHITGAQAAMTELKWLQDSYLSGSMGPVQFESAMRVVGRNLETAMWIDEAVSQGEHKTIGEIDKFKSEQLNKGLLERYGLNDADIKKRASDSGMTYDAALSDAINGTLKGKPKQGSSPTKKSYKRLW